MATSPSSLFQWGHDFSAMDREVEGKVIGQQRASFNGATTFQPWIEDVYLEHRGADNRFQWGHDFSAMDRLTPSRLRIRLCQPTRFQWGHDFSAMDRECFQKVDQCVQVGFNGATTFQPWIVNCRIAWEKISKVSMGPRLFSHG